MRAKHAARIEKDGKQLRLWDDIRHESLRGRLLHAHLNAVLETSSAGIHRTGTY